jgi:putative solute:sodium symporter small subunit
LSADPSAHARAHTYWRHTRRLTAVLLAIWGIVTFGVTFFARDLTGLFLGFPLGYWMASQGSLWVFLALIGCYAFVMGRLEA